MPTIEWIAVDALNGFLVPILVDEGHVVIAGHGLYAAAKLLGLKQVPAIEVRDLSEAKRRALALADNKIAENARLGPRAHRPSCPSSRSSWRSRVWTLRSPASRRSRSTS